MHHLRCRRTASWWSIVLIAALFATSCSSTDDAEEAEDTSSAPASSTTTTEAPTTTTTAPAPPEEPEREPVPDWPLDDTPLTIDEGVEVGTLDNGLTFYLRENDSPGSSITVRLAVDAGSLQQETADDGVAHFLEHMLFNGTERWPGNELDRVLQNIGAGIGPDINAYTSFDETVYELTVSTGDADAVTLMFDVLAEWAARATIEPAEVIAERGVIRDEYRQRVENGAAAIGNAVLAVYLTDTPYEDRLPIGSIEAIEATEAAELRAFYDTWYHPENMAIVVVGDLPTEDMRAQLDRAFADVEGRGDAPPRAERLEIGPNPEGFAGVVTHPEEVVDNLSVDWLRPPSDSATVGGAEADLLDDLIASMLGARLVDAYLAGDFAVDRTPYISRFGVSRNLDFFGTNLRGPDLEVAYEQMLGYLQAAAFDGFTADELDEAVSERESSLAAWEEAIPSTQDFTWSSAYVDHFLTGAGAEAPAVTIDRERAIMADLTVEDVSARWAFIHDRSGPIAVALGADPSTLPTADALEAIAADVTSIPPVTPDEPITELMAAPDPVTPDRIVDREGAFESVTVRRYANGATVVFEPSPIVEGTVSLVAEGLGGASTFAIDDHSLAFLVTSAVGRSGLADASTGQVDDYLADRAVGFEPYIDDYTEGFQGGASTEDLEILFQLLHLAVTAPQVDPTVLSSAIIDGKGTLERLQTDPGLQADAALGSLTYEDPAYDGYPTQDQLDSADAERVLDLYRQRLGGVDDLIISLVGDVDAETIADLADRYVGTLPAGDPDTFRDVSAPPVDTVERIDIALPGDSGDAGMLLRWETAATSSDDAAVSAMLEQILSSLIFDTAREELGASYGGGASVFTSAVPTDKVLGFVTIDGDPARLDEIQARLFADLNRLVTEGPTADELGRALSILEDDLQFINNFELILENIETERTGQLPAMSIYTRVLEVRNVTREDVRQLAAALFDLDAYIEIRRS
ncbi:MAG: insulinase family protein [Actinomycetota bacterium]